jgi:hypothetical protein
MKSKTLVLTAAALFVAVVACYAAGDAFMGTWKLNEAKSTIGAGMAKNSMVVYAPAGESVKVTVVGTNGDGTSLHSEWTGKFDGKYYPVTGDPTADSRSYEMVNDHTLTITSKQGDKVTTTVSSAVSADGKSRTATVTFTDAKGMKITATYVYDKQ